MTKPEDLIYHPPKGLEKALAPFCFGVRMYGQECVTISVREEGIYMNGEALDDLIVWLTRAAQWLREREK